MDNKQDKFSNENDYDLILEEKEKELKKEKRNKRILASSLLLLLLLGSTAVVAPIISIAVNNKNDSANINNIKIPNTLTFTNSDITTLIDGYKSEIQARKLSLKQFENDLVNITKKHIVASNIKIGTIVQSVTFAQNKETQTIFFNITLEENDKRQYLHSEDFSEATLTKNVLTIQKPDNVIMNDFFTETDPIDNTKLNDLLQQIQNWIKDNQFTKEEFENSINNGTLKDKIKDWLGINADLIGNIKYEQPKLIIEPKPPYTFVSDSNTDLIVDGNIEISNLKLYKIIKFINLDKLFNKLNEVIQSTPKGDKTTAEDFKKYLTTNPIDDIVYNNLEFINKSDFNKNDILNIQLNDADELVINLNDNYLKYEIENNSNFAINNNQLIISNLNFYIDGIVLKYSDFSFDTYKVSIDYSSWKPDMSFIEYIIPQNYRKIIFPERITNERYDLFSYHLFGEIGNYNTETESIDMSALTKWGGKTYHYPEYYAFETYTIPYCFFCGCLNLKEIILPKNTKKIWWWAFKECKNLKTINLPNSLIEIQEKAFESSGLESLVIPPNVTILGEEIFSDTTSMQWVKISSIIPNIDPTAFVTNHNKITIYVPTQELKDYYDDLINNNKLNNIKEVIVGEPPAN